MRLLSILCLLWVSVARASLPSFQDTLSATAVHPSGFAVTTNSTFTVSGAQSLTNSYDAAGNVTSRTFTDGRVQNLTWDAAGRLTGVTQRNALTNGYDFVAVYDGLGRRERTTYTVVLGGIAKTNSATVVDAWFDPQVEFQEVAVAVNGKRSWMIHGPDLNGAYGGLQGVGGLEATIRETDGQATGLVNDFFGNAVASVSSSPSSVAWNETRVGGYGPVPGSRARQLSENVSLSDATVWRSHRMDQTGFYCLGARYYEPISGKFLSYDPTWNRADASGYSFAGNDPVNGFDPDGRFGKGAVVGAKDLVVGTAHLGWNMAGSLSYGVASLAYGQDTADSNFGNQWGGLKATGSGLMNLGGQLANGQFEDVGIAMTGGEGQSAGFRTGYAATTVASILYGGELANFGKAGRVGEAAETFTQVANEMERVGVKTGFYVTADGVAIPATGYRAIGGPAVERAVAGDLMSQSGPTYISFNNLSELTGTEAKSVLQLKYEPSHFATFNTLQLVSDLKIPGGRWNASPLLEPITSTFPEFGGGGASQAITTTPIRNYTLTPFRKP